MSGQFTLFSSQTGVGETAISPPRYPHFDVIARDRAGYKGELHHILGRSKPRGWKSLPEPLKSAWPNVPMNMVVLSIEEHRPFSHISGRENKRRLLQGLLDQHGDRLWAGKTYREWLTSPPFSEYLRGGGDG